MEFVNSALLYDELLIDVINVLENNWPVGPKFLYSFGSLVEAFVLHDKVYYDVLNQTQREVYARGFGQIPKIIKDSNFVNQLQKEKLLHVFPEFKLVKKYLLDNGYTNEDLDWFLNLYRGPESFAIANPRGEKNELLILNDLIKIPKVFETHNFVHLDLVGLKRHYAQDEIQLLTNDGFNYKDINLLNALSHRSKGFLELANLLELNLYPTFPAIPNHILSIDRHNTRTRKLYESILSKIKEFDRDISIETEFFQKLIPPLGQLVLKNCKDSTKDIVAEIANIRNKHKKLRKYLTCHEIEWKNAKTRMDRVKLRIEFNNAWTSLMKRIERPKKRLLYNLWDILKEPHKIHVQFGNKLTDEARELSIIEKVNGLSNFWDDMVNSPLPERNFEILSKLFKQFVDDETWDLANTLSKKINEVFVKVRFDAPESRQ